MQVRKALSEKVSRERMGTELEKMFSSIFPPFSIPLIQFVQSVLLDLGLLKFKCIAQAQAQNIVVSDVSATGRPIMIKK